MQPPGGNPVFNNLTNGTKRHEIAEGVETPVPADSGADETQLLPVSELAVLKTYNAASFCACESLQAGDNLFL
jgi:hypothetical protein